MTVQQSYDYRDRLAQYLAESDGLGKHEVILEALRKLDMGSHVELAELSGLAWKAQRKEGKPGSPLCAIIDFCAVLRVVADGDNPRKEKPIIDAGGYEYVDRHTYARRLEDSLYFAGPREQSARQPWYPKPSDRSKRWHSWWEALSDPMSSKYTWSASQKREYIEAQMAQMELERRKHDRKF